MYDVRGVLARLKDAYQVSSFKELAQKLGVSVATIDAWRARKSIPDKYLLKALQEQGVSKDWLLTGEGPMRAATSMSPAGDDVEVNYYPEVFASAGFGVQNYEIEPQKVRLAGFILKLFRVKDVKRVDLINVIGESMQPYFDNGDIAVIERIDSIEDVRNGDTVIANIGGDVYIKKIEKIPFEKAIILKSANPNYSDIVVREEELDDLKVVAIVRGKLRGY